MMKIQEIIVVEGKHDTLAIKRAVNADTIETNGSEISTETIEKIKRAQEIRGVIILTDPDFPGEKIRKIIAQAVPNCSHAFLPKAMAIPKNGKGVGVEYATPEAIREALRETHTMQDQPEVITKQILLELGIIAGPKARMKREKLGNILNIGYANSKQFHQRLMIFGVTLKEFQEALKEI